MITWQTKLTHLIFSKRVRALCGLSLSLYAISANAYLSSNATFKHPFYIGILGGYGSTTWRGLVPAKQNQNGAMLLSTPVSVNEGGGAYGVFLGYEFNPFFALEANYTRYPNAKVSFDAMSLVAFENNGLQDLITHTETISIMGKVFVRIPQSNARFYSAFGATDQHRYDELSESWRLSPTFGLGLNYLFSENIMADLEVTYTSGYGESEVNPATDYIPFLYGGFFRLGYRFG